MFKFLFSQLFRNLAFFVTAPSAPTTGAFGNQSTLQTTSSKTGAHTHGCLQGHYFVCTYTTSCNLEMLVGANGFIQELCPVCHKNGHGNYAS